MTPNEPAEGTKWIFAKTFAETAPHEYILEEQYPEFFSHMAELISEHGVDQPFTIDGKIHSYRYFYAGGYRYWIIENILNRCPQDQPNKKAVNG
jgi:hypothetical protein